MTSTTGLAVDILDGFEAINAEWRDSWPRVIQSSVVYSSFARELAQTFHEEFEGLVVLDARKIVGVLDTDFFELDVRINACVLPSLAVYIHLSSYRDRWTVFDAGSLMLPGSVNMQRSQGLLPAYLANCFASLLLREQRLKHIFKLVVFLYTRWSFRGRLSLNWGVDYNAFELGSKSLSLRSKRINQSLQLSGRSARRISRS